MDPRPDGARVQHGEWPALAMSLGYFFCVLTAYYVIRPVREQLVGAVGSTQLPWFYAATFVATLALTPLFAGLVARWPRRVMVPVVYGVFVACLLAFVPLFMDPALLGPRALGIVFFVWVSVFNLFVVSVFWIFMSDVWTPVQARRLFPIIALAGTLGSLVGPALTRSLVGVIGVASLLLVSAALLGAAMLLSMLVGRWARDHRSMAGLDDAPLGGGMLDGLKQIFATPFMRYMAILLILSDGIGGVNYALLADYSKATFADEAARTGFFATVDLVTNSVIIGLQALITWWLLPLLGPGRILVVWASIAMLALGLVIVSSDPYAPLVAGMPAVAIATIVSRGLAFGMAEPARHALFTQVARNERYKGQNAVDTAVWRFGDLLVALLMNAGRAAGVGVAGFAAMGAGAAALAAGVGWRLSRRGGDRAPAA